MWVNKTLFRGRDSSRFKKNLDRSRRINSEKCKKDVASTLKKENSKGKADKIELPFVLCIDCLFIEKEEKKRLQFNNALRNLISKNCRWWTRCKFWD